MSDYDGSDPADPKPLRVQTKAGADHEDGSVVQALRCLLVSVMRGELRQDVLRPRGAGGWSHIQAD